MVVERGDDGGERGWWWREGMMVERWYTHNASFYSYAGY